MTPQRLFARKVAYVVAIAVLLVPLYMLSHPATRGTESTPGSPGGQLAQLREKYELSQAHLGDIDPASEAAKLATLGMRGVATNILWTKASHEKKTKDWTSLSATLNQITRLQPNFITVWQFQSWNLSYNVSQEFDDYRERYRWVIKGLEFIIRGIDYNKREPRLPDTVGRMLTTKMGRSDEHDEFRPMFKADDDYHEKHHTPSVAMRDSWLNGQMWFRQAEGVVKEGAPLEHASPMIFFASAPMCQMHYATAIEEEGTFGEKARQQWIEASEQWDEYGSRRFATIEKDEQGETIMVALNDRAVHTARMKEYEAQLDALQPGLREELQWKTWNDLTRVEKGTIYEDLCSDNPERDPEIIAIQERLDREQPTWREDLKGYDMLGYTAEQREAVETPALLRTSAQKGVATAAQRQFAGMRTRTHRKLSIEWDQVAEAIQGENRARALELSDLIDEERYRSNLSKMEGDIVSFKFWHDHSESQQSDHALAAHEAIYDARQLYAETAVEEASDRYLDCMQHWSDLLTCGDYPDLVNTSRVLRDVVRIIEKYTVLLDQLDRQYPEGYPLEHIMARYVRASHPAFAARRDIKQAETLIERGDYETAKKAYENALSDWYRTMSEIPSLELMSDRKTGEEILEHCADYARLLDKMGEELSLTEPMNRFVRTQMDHSPEIAEARRQSNVASALLSESKFAEAEAAYLEAMRTWAKVLDRFPAIYHGLELSLLQQIDETLNGYETTLARRGTEPVEDHPLQEYLDRQKSH